MNDDATLIAALVRVGQQPAVCAKEYAALTCKCSFCHAKLTDEGSIDVGYGPKCASNYGLPHHPKGTATPAVA